MNQSPMVDDKIRYDGLTSEVTKEDLHLYRTQHSGGSAWARYVATFMVAVFIIVGVVSIVIGLLDTQWEQSMIGFMLTGFGALASAGWAIMARQADILAIRLGRFAEQNGLLYSRGPVAVGHQGVIFQIGHSRRADNVIEKVSSDDGLRFEMGDYQYTTGSGKNRRTSYWTYFCVELDRNVPHMLLDAISNNISLFGRSIMSNLPETFNKGQVLSLEGDFNKHFTLYAPKEYKQDAYYVFTPDLMALLIDNARNFDAEVIDNKVFFYTPRYSTKSPFVQPDFMQGVMNIIQNVGSRVHRRTDYYADENIANRAIDIVATEGRRLKKSVNWLVVVVVVLIFAANIFMFMR